MLTSLLHFNSITKTFPGTRTLDGVSFGVHEGAVRALPEKDVASVLGLSVRMARVLLTEWVGDGWLVVADPSRRKRSYELSAMYRQYNGTLSAIKPNE